MESTVVVGNVVGERIVGVGGGMVIGLVALAVVVTVLGAVMGVSTGQLVVVVNSIVVWVLVVATVVLVVTGVGVAVVAAAVVVDVDAATPVVACSKLTLSEAAVAVGEVEPLSGGKVGKAMLTRVPPFLLFPTDVLALSLRDCVAVSLFPSRELTSLLVSSSSSKSASKSERSVVGRLLPSNAGSKLGPATRITWPIMRLTMSSICYNGKG